MTLSTQTITGRARSFVALMQQRRKVNLLHLPISLKNRQTSTIQIILNCGANIHDYHATDNEENSALHYAALAGFVYVMETLLQKGESVNAVNSNGETPLMLAERGGSYDAVKMLLNHGTDADAITRKGTTALHELNRITGNGNDKFIFEALLEHDFDIEKYEQSLLRLLLADHTLVSMQSSSTYVPSLSHTARPMERQKHQNYSCESVILLRNILPFSLLSLSK